MLRAVEEEELSGWRNCRGGIVVEDLSRWRICRRGRSQKRVPIFGSRIWNQAGSPGYRPRHSSTRQNPRHYATLFYVCATLPREISFSTRYSLRLYRICHYQTDSGAQNEGNIVFSQRLCHIRTLHPDIVRTVLLQYPRTTSTPDVGLHPSIHPVLALLRLGSSRSRSGTLRSRSGTTLRSRSGTTLRSRSGILVMRHLLLVVDF